MTVDDDGELLTAGELAAALGVALSAVSNWRKRFPEFPRGQGSPERFARGALLDWLGTRRIPGTKLGGDEAPGTTYADRLRGGSSAVRASAGAAAPVVDAGNRLWEFVDALHAVYPMEVAQELLVSLIHLKMTRHDRWAGIVDADSWFDVCRLLADTEVEFAGRLAPVPVFQRLDTADDRGFRAAIQYIDRLPLEFTGVTTSSEISAFLEEAGRRTGRHTGRHTPVGVAECMVELIDPAPGSTIYDPNCSSGELLVAAGRRRADARYHLCGGVRTLWNQIAAQANLAVNGVRAELRRTDLEVDGFAGLRFDHVITNPPFGTTRLSVEGGTWPFGDPGRSMELAWLQHAYAKLSPHGRAAVVLPAGAAYRGHAAAVIRAGLVESGALECVISLPPGLFSDAGVQTMIWVLCGEARSRQRSPSVMMIDADEPLRPGDRRPRLTPDHVSRIVNTYRSWRNGERPTGSGLPEYGCVVGVDQLRGNQFDLTPRRYCAVQGDSGPIETARSVAALSTLFQANRLEVESLDEHAEAVLAGVAEQASSRGRRVALGSICDVLQGAVWARSAKDGAPAGPVLIQPRNIHRGRIVDGDLRYLDTGRYDLPRYAVQEGDIVTARTGTLGRFGLVEREQAGRIVGSACLLLRPSADVEPRYLHRLLESTSAQQWLMENATGTVIPAIATTRLRSMPVLLPGLPEQRAIADTLDLLARTATAHAQLGELLDELRGRMGSLLTFPAGDTSA